MILPLQYSDYWILLIYTREQGLLQEYNSLPSTSNVCTGGSIVPDFLRWAPDDQGLHATFRKMAVSMLLFQSLFSNLFG